MDLRLWFWALSSVLLLAAEIVSREFLVLPFAIAAAAAALLEIAGVGVGGQWLAFVGISSVLFVVVNRLGRGREEKPAEESPRR